MVRHIRRDFLKAGAVAAVGSLSKTRRIHAADAVGASVAITPALNQFGYGEVELLEGPIRQQLDRNHTFFVALDEDMLLRTMSADRRAA
jgi:hypothetical protein